MAVHRTVITSTGRIAKTPAEIVTDTGDVVGMSFITRLGASETQGSTVGRPIHGICGAGADLDDALFLDPGNGVMGDQLTHTQHYPGSNPGFINEGPH